MTSVSIRLDSPGFPDITRHKAERVPLKGERITIQFRGKPIELDVVRSSAMPGEENTFAYYGDWAICREAR